jgi:Mg-chelatase subunit ChlD
MESRMVHVRAGRSRQNLEWSDRVQGRRSAKKGRVVIFALDMSSLMAGIANPYLLQMY